MTDVSSWLRPDTVAEENGELVIRFEFRPDAEKRRQDALNANATKAIFEAPATAAWLFALAALDPSEADPNRTVLTKHLKDYTARNTFDYFIHKDVGSFLRRELDFFIKNEVMHLDDVESSSAPRVEQYLSRIRVLRNLATKLIDFVAQLEDFQKKLWLKKKFVVESNYCMTLDRVPEELYGEIAVNASQVDEWVRLFRLDLIHGDFAEPGFSVPPTAEFLRSQPTLVLDTRHFGKEFKDRLLSSPKLADIDDATDGLLVQADSFQALSTLLNSYRGAAKTIYIDPPYNTKKDIFPYKDGYKHGSWLSMIADRISLGRQLLRSDGVFFSSIDTNELPRLQLLLNEVFGVGNHIGDIVWRNARDNNPTQIAVEHEYVVCYAKDAAFVEPIWKNSFADAKELLQAEYQRLKEAGLAMSEIQDGIRTFIKDNEDILAEVDRYKFVDEDGVYTGSQSVHNPHPNGYDFEILHRETGRPMRKPANGYRFPESTMKREYIDKDRLIYGPDENRIVQIKLYLKDYQDSLRSVIDLDGRLGAYALSALFGKGSDLFDNPKPPQLLKRLISFGSAPDSLVLDFFAGSGSTVQAAIEVARQTSVRMKYICVEMAGYFETVLIPRVKKVIYSDDWKDGTPVSRRGSSHVFKYVRLESYEDSLNNLELRRTEVQGSLLETNAGLREDYNLRYMLDVESKGSASLLNIDAFREPFSYTLKVSTGTVGETDLTSADLVETFNYLLGLHVKHIDTIRGFRVVHGTNSGGEKVLVIWRNLEENPNANLDEFFQKQGYNTKDMEFDLIYVNGDNNLENLKKDEDTWKVRLIEEEFARLMFDVQEV
jgi:adenine-specific DNA-methyltransferase